MSLITLDLIPYHTDEPATAQTSLFVSALPAGTTEEQLKALLPDPSSVKSVVLVAASNCGFVNFVDRPATEAAALIWGASGGRFKIAGADGTEKEPKVQWGRSRKPAVAAVAAT